MSGSDGELSLRKASSTLRSASLSPLPSLSLTRDHITEAFAKSPDGGATLDLAYKGLTDVGESGAEELATVGQDDENVTESPVVRYVYPFALQSRSPRPSDMRALALPWRIIVLLRYLWPSPYYLACAISFSRITTSQYFLTSYVPQPSSSFPSLSVHVAHRHPITRNIGHKS